MKHLGLKITCLVAALIIWIQVASTTVIEADVRLPVSVVNLGPELTVAGNALPELIDVRLRASKLRVLAHRYLGRNLGRVQVDLANRQPGPSFSYELTPADVVTEQEVVTVPPPARLSIRLDREVTRRLPVRVAVTGELPAGRLLLSPPAPRPDTVAVRGPERFFRGVTDVATEPLRLDPVSGPVTQELNLVRPHAHLEPLVAEVAVTVNVAELEERVLANVPVIPLVDADQADVAVSPPVCDLMVRGPADSVRALTAADLTVTIPLSGLGEGMHEVRGEVSHPAWVTQVAVEPEVFLVIIGGEATPDGTAPREREP